jgi:Pyruvate/2-oxoacid:ferredoxin oxidoreductase delta subunit
MDRFGSGFSFLASVRNRFQSVLFLLTLAVGVQFYLFVAQAGGDGPITIQRPAGVEGFLPIGALLGWKQLLTTGVWDPIHPAAMVILFYAAAISLLLRKSFCSWFCPVGTVSEWLWKLGGRMFGRNLQPPAWLDWPLRTLKYLMLSFFVYITIRMSSAEIAAFLNTPYYKMADVKMLHFFTHIGIVAGVTVAVLLTMSVFIRNFWCRYLCPYGALMGIFALFSPTRVQREADTCTNCLKCTRICPSHLPVHKRKQIVSPECSGCLDCVNICPSAGTLSMKTTAFGSAHWNAPKLAIALGVGFILLFYTAQFTGHWQSALSDGEFRMLLRMIDSPLMTHPTF